MRYTSICLSQHTQIATLIERIIRFLLFDVVLKEQRLAQRTIPRPSGHQNYCSALGSTPTHPPAQAYFSNVSWRLSASGCSGHRNYCSAPGSTPAHPPTQAYFSNVSWRLPASGWFPGPPQAQSFFFWKETILYISSGPKRDEWKETVLVALEISRL